MERVRNDVLRVCKLCGEITYRFKSHLNDTHEIQTKNIDIYSAILIHPPKMVKCESVEFKDIGLVNLNLVTFEDESQCIWIVKPQPSRIHRYRIRDYWTSQSNNFEKIYNKGLSIVISTNNEISPHEYTSGLIKFNNYVEKSASYSA